MLPFRGKTCVISANGATAEIALKGWPTTVEIALDDLVGFVAKYTRPPAPLSETLSAREIEVAELTAQGLCPKDVAAQLCISVYTVRNHIKSIYRKLGVHNAAALVARIYEARP